MLRNILIAAAIAVAAVLVWAALRPDRFRVERSVEIAAPPATIFALIDDFHAWPQWSPYEKLDPAMQRHYSEPAVGVGANYAWDGNGKAGAGRMQIVAAVPATRIVIQLDFSRPFATRNEVQFTLQPDGDRTHLSWAMTGPSPYIARLMGIFFDMDKMIGGDFETGLAGLKAVAEAQSAAAARPAP